MSRSTKERIRDIQQASKAAGDDLGIDYSSSTDCWVGYVNDDRITEPDPDIETVLSELEFMYQLCRP